MGTNGGRESKQMNKRSISSFNLGLLKVAMFVEGHLVDPRGKNAQWCGREASFPDIHRCGDERGRPFRTNAGSESYFLTGGRVVDFPNSHQLLCAIISHFLSK